MTNRQTDAFAELEHQLKQAERELEDWQEQTRALELHSEECAGKLREAGRVQNTTAERQREALDAQIEQRTAEEDRLKREVSGIEADFEAYSKKLDTARHEREQLLAEIEQLK